MSTHHFQRQADHRREQHRGEHEAGDVAELAGDEAAAKPRLQKPVVDDEQDHRRERDRMEGLADRQDSRTILTAQRSPQPFHSYMVPFVSESDKPSEQPPSESAKQLAEA